MGATVLASRQVPTGGGSGGANYINRTLLAADVVNNNATANTLADVAGLSFAVESGKRYKFRFFIVYTAAATTTGSRWTINGPTTTQLDYRSEYTLTATSRTFNHLSAYNSPAASNATSVTAGNTAIIEGTLTPSANGTLIARFASEIANSAITAKANVSYVEWEEITEQTQGSGGAGGASLTPLDAIAKYAYGWEDFYQGNYPNGWFSGLYENNSTGYITVVPSDQDAAGVAAFVNGGAGGRAGLISYYAQCLRLGGGEAILEFRMRLDGSLSDATNAFTVRLGFMDDVGGDPVDGVFFRYTHDVNGGNWQGVTRNNTSESTVNLATAPVTSGWQKLRLVVNAAGNSVEFFINAVSKGTLTTNIPTAAGRETALGASIVGNAGASRSFLLDYLGWQIELNR